MLALQRMKFWVDFKYLWLEQMMEIRVAWYWYLLFSLVIPLAMVFGFARFGRGLTDQSSLIYIISGSAIFAVVNDGLYAMAIRLGSMKKEGILVYYASLPISRVAFAGAIMFSRLVVLLPGMLCPILLGSAIYGIKLELNPWIVVLLPLTALSMSVMGMVIGLAVDNLEMTNWIVTSVLFLVVMAAPVFIPITALPLPLQFLSYAFPPTYAADALRRLLLGDVNLAFYLDMAMLALMVVVSFFVFKRWSFWRLR